MAQGATLTDDELAKKYATTEGGTPTAGALSEDELAQKYGNAAAREATPEEKQAQTKIRSVIQPVPPTRLESLMQPLPRTPGSEEEAIREGSGPAVAGLSAIGTLGMPVRAIATRSLEPLVPLARAYLGSKLGGYVGRDIGGRLGHPEAGGTIGEIGGGIAGAAGVKVPSKVSLLKNFLSYLEPEAETATATRLQPASEAPASVPVRVSETPTPGRLARVPRAESQTEMDIRLGNVGPRKPMMEEIRDAEARTQAETEARRENFERDQEAQRLQPVGAKPAENSIGLTKIVNQATGAKPLEKGVPIGEQLTPAAREGRLAKVQPAEVKPVETDPIKLKYPDAADRQMVRANGERMFEAAKGNKDTMKAVHDLTRVEIRQALINSGEDMGQQTVSNSKFAGEGSIPREEAFNRLLDKKLSPEKIVELAKKEIPKGAK